MIRVNEKLNLDVHDLVKIGEVGRALGDLNVVSATFDVWGKRVTIRRDNWGNTYVTKVQPAPEEP